MKFKFLPIAAIFGCSIFGSALAQTQICPVGGGACFSQPAPASSYSSARAVDMTVRQPVPVLPTAADLARQIAILIPTDGTGRITTEARRYEAAGFSTEFFCVQGVGVDTFGWCPLGSGVFVIGRAAIDTGGGRGDQQ